MRAHAGPVGAEPTRTSVGSTTALPCTTWCGGGAQLPEWTQHVDAARLLLPRGADPNLRTRTDDCTSALDEAMAGDATELAEVLARRGRN